MFWYIVRVQLVKEKADYAKLHEEMEARGFKRETGFGSDDEVLRLPLATYFYEGNETGDQVRTKAWNASRKVDLNKNRILVIRTDALWSKNLTPV
jgi:hypothetical protein